MSRYQDVDYNVKISVDYNVKISVDYVDYNVKIYLLIIMSRYNVIC